jgi:hypothetical protein
LVSRTRKEGKGRKERNERNERNEKKGSKGKRNRAGRDEGYQGSLTPNFDLLITDGWQWFCVC